MVSNFRKFWTVIPDIPFKLSFLLCISTSKQVLRMLFAGKNQFLTLKQLFAYF